jgi:hypothetical protein
MESGLFLMRLNLKKMMMYPPTAMREWMRLGRAAADHEVHDDGDDREE